MTREPRVAIVHEWFVSYAGSERVVEQLLKVFPNARIFSLVDFLSDEERASMLGGRQTSSTFIQKLPGARTKFRRYLPLMPLAVEQHDLTDFDIVISSSHAVAKGVLTGPDQLHISYVHSPIRYAWDLQHQYLAESGLTSGLKGWFAKGLLHYMRLWDARTANGVDHFVANSEFIARRIAKAYRRDARVIYPPVDIDAFPMRAEKQPFYVVASRMVPYKRMPLIVEAFAGMPERRLVVLGEGPDHARCKAIATPNVELLGYESGEVLQRYLSEASAFVFAAEEDFGITMVEAQACGTPVIAFGKGGALEIVRDLDGPDEPTGVLFGEQSVEAIRDAVRRFEANSDKITPQACRSNAERFSAERFGREVAAYVEHAWNSRLDSYGHSYTAPAQRSIAAE